MNSLNRAFKMVTRAGFLPPAMQDASDFDAPLPIGYGQTNSQPSTVRLMLAWLDPRPGEKILDVGYGSGWTTALLANLVGPTGLVYAVEKVPELVRFGAANCRRFGVDNARFFAAGDSVGLADFAPYDRILVSAASSKLPAELLKQLKVDGTMVIPIKHSIAVITKTGADHYDSVEHPGFVFVPLV